MVARLLARVAVQPPALGGGPHLGPHVVCPVEDPTRVVPERAAAQRERVGPLAASARARLEELHRVVVPREAYARAARDAAVRLHARGAVGGFVRGRGRRARRGDVGGTARAARGRIAPREEVALEPAEQSAQQSVLPRRGDALLARRQCRLRLGLETVEGDDGERRRASEGVLVRQSGAHPAFQAIAEPALSRPGIVRTPRERRRHGSRRSAILLLLKPTRQLLVRVHGDERKRASARRRVRSSPQWRR